MVFVHEMHGSKQTADLLFSGWWGSYGSPFQFKFCSGCLGFCLLEVLSKKLGSWWSFGVVWFFLFFFWIVWPIISIHLRSPNPWLLGGVLMTYQVPSSLQSKMLLQSKMRCYGVIAFAGELSKSRGDNVHIFQEQYPGKLLM